MDSHLKKTRKQEMGPPTLDKGRDRATHTLQCCQTGDADLIQPLDRTGNGSDTWENYVASIAATFGNGKLPPISTLFKKRPLNQGVSSEVRNSGDGDVQSETLIRAKKRPPSGAQSVPIQVTERLDASHAAGIGEPMNQGPVHLSLTSPWLRGDSPVTCFTIPPTEEDLIQMQSSQDKYGHIKRPMNAFMVWSHIHRNAMRTTRHGASMIDVSVKLGSEWSKLSEEQKRPYFEVADKLKHMHKQRFPDYEFRPRRKKSKECLSSDYRGAGDEPSTSCSASEATTHPAQPQLLDPSMQPHPAMMQYTVGYYPNSCFCQYQPMGYYSRVQIHRSRICYRSPDVSCPMEGGRNYYYTHLQGYETLTSEITQQEHHQTDVIDSTTTSRSLELPDILTSLRLSADNKEESKCEDDVDVVGLL